MQDIQFQRGRKIKGVRIELNKFIEEWLDSIKDPLIKAFAKKDVIITGGSIASLLMGVKVNDFDVYFRTKETTLMVAQYYVNQFNELNPSIAEDSGGRTKTPYVKEAQVTNIKGELEDRIMIYMKSSGVAAEDQLSYEYFEGSPEEAQDAFFDSVDKAIAQKTEEVQDKYRPVFLSQNAVTLSDKAQVVIRFFGEPDKIHSNYDFVHAMCYYDYANNKLETPKEALLAMMSKTLVYKGSLYPMASIFRTRKFLERGWNISAGQLLKIMWQISELDLSNKEILYEQLTGVDQAYMYQIIDAIKHADPEKINSAYISVVIERIFE